jgi:hypothetical protein
MSTVCVKVAEENLSDEYRMTTFPSKLMRVEKYDEDMMKQMLCDTTIAHEERKRLSAYFKGRDVIGKRNVVYGYPSTLEEKRLGRMYPVSGMGLQSFRFDIRNPLLKKHYWDIDVENCHYNIALKFATDLGLKCDAITEYCANRNACLATVSSDRSIAKTQFLKTLYGGELSLYDPMITDQLVTLGDGATALIRRLTMEVSTLADNIWMRNTGLHKVKTGKDAKPIDKKWNAKFCLMSLMFQDEEKKILLCADKCLADNGRTEIGVLIHDGGCVEKLDGEIEFPSELLMKLSETVKTTLGYNLTFTQKPMTTTYTPPAVKGATYESLKDKFEKRNFLIGSMFHCVHQDGKKEIMKFSEAKIKFANWKYEGVNPVSAKIEMLSFLPKWLEDSSRRDYESCDFIPNRDGCPPTVFNLFHGFEAEKIAEDIPTDEIASLIAPIIYHLNTLTSGNADYLLKWFANMLQKPHIKSDVSPLFRDMGGLLFEGGGTGKNLFFDWFGNQILGEDYYVVIGNNAMLYSSFNSIFEGKLLVVIEEACGKDNHQNTDKLNSIITTKKKVINKKNVAEYGVNDYARWAFCSNNVNPLPSRGGASRRIAPMDTDPKHRGDTEYFNALVASMDNPRVQKAFFSYLMTAETYTKPIEFQVSIPITDAYIEIRRMNAPPHHKWLVEELRDGTLPDKMNARELYARFKCWFISSDRAGEKPLSETMFGRYMKEGCEEDGVRNILDGVNDVRSSSGVSYSFDLPKLVKGLEKLRLLKEGEVSTGELLIKAE